MSIAIVIDALALPANTLVNQRIPKKSLVEHGASTTTDKRQILDGIEDLHWVAALKPSNIGVPAFQDTERNYLEIAVLTAAFRPHAKVSRLTEVIHRAVPYPLLLLSSYHDDTLEIAISTAHKRFAQNEAGKFVVEEVVNTNHIDFDAAPSSFTQAFLASLALSRLPTRNLFLFYQGWIDRIVGLSAAKISGRFDLPKSPECAVQMRESIANYSQTLAELSALRKQADKEKQMNRLVKLNINIKQLECKLAENKTMFLKN